VIIRFITRSVDGMFLPMVEPLPDALPILLRAAPGTVLIRSPRLRLRSFEMADAEGVFACITPAVARFMTWEPPNSFAEFAAQRQAMLDAKDPGNLSLVIRQDDNSECLGVAALESADAPCPTLGLWLKVEAQGCGYGREVVGALVGWASHHRRAEGFHYSVAAENVRSRRIAESLGGVIISHHATPKYAAIVYRIPAIVPRESLHG